VQTTAVAQPSYTPNEEQLRSLARKRVFFGHKSVGANILEGVGEVIARFPGVGPRVVAADGGDTGPGIVHAGVGRNFDPLSKIEDFARRVRGGIGGSADVALFKFCFVDVDRSTDVVGLFEEYKAVVAELEAAYPTTKFAHATVPLNGVRRDWKGLVKRLLGRAGPYVEDNASRERFNELVRREYGGRGLVFDIAAAESVREDGTACTGQWDGRAVPCLCPEYATDGGHLSTRGRRRLAGYFLTFLAGL
jgi:hypothetical protein